MKNYLIIFLLSTIFFSCKKEKKTPEETATPPAQTIPTTLPPSTFKRVKMIKQYDTLSYKKIETINYEYSFVTGLMAKETIIDSIPNSSTPVSITTNVYSYGSNGKIDTYTTTTATGTSIIKYIYNASNQPVQQLDISVPALDTSVAGNYSNAGNQTVFSRVNGANGTYLNYTDGDLMSTAASSQFFSYIITYQATYDGILIDKSKKNFSETAPLTATCKLLSSEYYPASPFTTTPYTVTYTYTYDSDGYPTAYGNSQGIKWRINYY